MCTHILKFSIYIVTYIPYIPGSSLKGKIRSLLEQIAGSAEVGGNDEINNLFGFAKDNRTRANTGEHRRYRLFTRGLKYYD